jgi:hypothetical protein
MPDLESRSIDRPESEHDDRCAFSQFLTAGFTNRGPFPERNTL